MSKFDRLVKTLPSFYRAEVNTYLRGLLKAWGVSDDEVQVQISEAKKQLFVKDSSARFLDRNANNFGVDRTPELGLDDTDFRRLVPVLSTFPKQVRNSLIALFDVFWGAGFTRANLNSGNVEPFNFGAPTNLTGTFSFKQGDRSVRGDVSLFLTEVQPGDYIRPLSSDDRSFARISRVISDDEIELSTPWNGATIALSGAVITNPLTLSYTADGTVSRIVRFAPSAFADVTAVKVQEIAEFINSSIEHNQIIDAGVFLDPLSGNKLNLRTKTPGLRGSIQVTGGTANGPAVLNFPGTTATEVKAAVYEINPNEIVVQIPSTVPVLRRTLKGATHPKGQKTQIQSVSAPFNFTTLGASSTLNITIDGNAYVVTFAHASDFDDAARATAGEVVDAINRQLLFLRAFTKEPGTFRSVGLRTTDGSSEYQVTGGNANTVLQFPTSLQTDPDVIQTDYPSAYIFDPNGQLFTVTGINAKLSQAIGQGSSQPTVSVDDASDFPSRPGLLLFNFGRSEQEGPIPYNSRPNNSTLLIDAAHIFQKHHDVSRFVNLVSDSPTIPRVTGDDYPVFIVGTQQARVVAQNLIRRLIASGVVIRFIIDFPEVLFECTISVPDSADYVGSRSATLDPLFTC